MKAVKVMNKYDKQAQDFMEKTGTTFKAELLGHMPYFEDDKESRDVYQIILTRGDNAYSFRFGQSIANSKIPDNKPVSLRERREHKVKKPTPYDVLAAVTKSDPGTFSDFCSEYGYDTDLRKAEKTYFAVQEEWKNINRMFHDVMDELQEIA